MLTPGFPPRYSGVGDHAARFAQAAIAQGDDVIVLTEGTSRESEGVSAFAVGESWTIAAALRAVRIALRLRADVFYIQYTPFAFGVRSFAPLVFAIAACVRRIPLGVYLHEAFYTAGSEAVSTWGKSLVLNCRDALLVTMARDVFVADEDRKRVVLRAVPWKRRSAVVVAPIGANIEPVPGRSWAPRFRDVRARHRLITFGIVSPRRRLELLIDAVAELKERGFDTDLRIVGMVKDHPYAQTVRERAGTRKVEDCITWLDRLDPPDVSEALFTSDLFLFASTDGVTSSSSVFMVALAHGIPIVHVKNHKDDESFNDVLLSASATGSGIADAVANGVSEQRASAERGLLGLELYERRYTWSTMTRTIRGVLSRVTCVATLE